MYQPGLLEHDVLTKPEIEKGKAGDAEDESNWLCVDSGIQLLLVVYL
jgi:hypothetical protein